MARITVEDCIDKFESRFELVLVASNRARKLHTGETPTVEKDNDKNTVIALREIADETISIDDMKKSLVEEYQTVSAQTEEDLSLEYSDLEKENIEQDEQEIFLKTENDIIEKSPEPLEASLENKESDLKTEEVIKETEEDKSTYEEDTTTELTDIDSEGVKIENEEAVDDIIENQEQG